MIIKEKHFVNLTNGILAIPDLVKENLNYEFIRIQSTTLENKNWIKLFSDLDHNFLMNLALGNTCIVYDFGTNRPYSKTIYSGLPIIEFILNKYWYNRNDDGYRLCRNGERSVHLMTDYYNTIYKELFVNHITKDKIHLKNKLNYYKKYLNSDQVCLHGISKSTDMDGQFEYMANLLKNLN